MSPLYNPQTFIDWPSYYNGAHPYRESVPRQNASSSSVVIGTTGIMYYVVVPCVAGDVVTNVSVRWGGTPATGPTHWWFALYNTASALLSQTADQTSTAIAAGTNTTLALGAPQTIPSTGLYPVGIMVATSTTQPTICGAPTAASAVLSGGIVSGQVQIAGTAGSGLTTTAAGTIVTPSLSSQYAYVVLS